MRHTLYIIIGCIMMMLTGTVTSKAQDSLDVFHFRLGFIGGSVIADGYESEFYCGSNRIGTIKEVLENPGNVTQEMPWTIVNKDYYTSLYVYPKENVTLQQLADAYAQGVTGALVLKEDNSNPEEGNFNFNVQVVPDTRYHEVSQLALFNYDEADGGKQVFTCTALYDLRFCNKYALVEIKKTTDAPMSLDSLYHGITFSSTSPDFAAYQGLTIDQMDSTSDGYEMFPMVVNALISKTSGKVQQNYRTMETYLGPLADNYRQKMDKYPQSYSQTNCNHRIKFGVFK